MKATGRQLWFGVADTAASDVSHSTTDGVEGPIALNDTSSSDYFICLNASSSELKSGKPFISSRGLTTTENLGIQRA